MANILIVDDSRASRRVLRDVIEELGHRIVGEAENGEQGYLRFKELKPDLVFMDLTMPKMSGLEALQLIMNEDKEARVIMLTSAGQKDNRLKARQIGAVDYLTKPIDSYTIMMTIEGLLIDN
jgi:two-component system chemotaxis response regulator CheY